MDPQPDTNPETAAPVAAPELSLLLVSLLKGVLYRDEDERAWASLMRLQPRVREQAAILLLDLVVDEAEGHAFLKSRPETEEDGAGPALPRLVARRPLSWPVSLLLALLRKRLAEFDAMGGDTRLVLGREDIAELLRVFLAEDSNEARLADRMDAHINKVVELGFLRRLAAPAGSGRGSERFEVRRILKAFIDAQWLADFDARLAAYHALASGAGPAAGDGE